MLQSNAMTDVTSVYITVNDEDDECFEVCSEESSASFCLADKNNKPPPPPATATVRSPPDQQRMNSKSPTECIAPNLMEVINSNSAEDELFTVSAEDYSSAFVLELPRIQPTVSDLSCFLDILAFSKRNEEDEEPKKKKGLRIKNRETYPLPQAIDARDNIVPQESSRTRKMNYNPKTSKTIRRSEQQQTSVLPLRTGEERKPKRRNSLSSIASTPSTTCHYLAGSFVERRLSVTSATASTNVSPSRNNSKTKSVDAASCAVSTTSAAKRRPGTRARRSRRLKGDKHHQKRALDAIIAGEGFSKKTIATSTTSTRSKQSFTSSNSTKRQARRHTMFT